MTQMHPPPHDLEEFDQPSETAVPIVLSESLLLRGRRVAGVVTSFLLGQGATQAISVLTGLFLVRRLTVEAYAQFGIATGFQSVFVILMDLGFASTIVPLVGSRSEDRALIGGYVRSARELRDRTFWLLAPVVSVAFLVTVSSHRWGLGLKLALLASLLLTLASSGLLSVYSAPLFLRGKLREYYVPQAVSGASRLIAYVVLNAVGGLNAWTAAGLGALNITLNGTLVRRAAMKYLDWPAATNREAGKEMLALVLPATPAIVFSAFQSQISLFLISIFGSTQYIAEVAALGRIGAFFTMLVTFHSIVVEPYVARLDRDRLAAHFAGLVLLFSAAFVPVVFAAFRWPGIFLWILGAKFAALSPVIGWYVLSASMNFITGLVWIMNRGRKWVFWSGSILEVVLLLAAQMLFLIFVGVRTTREAVFFMLASSVCGAVAHGYVTIKGFLQPREVTP